MWSTTRPGMTGKAILVATDGSSSMDVVDGASSRRVRAQAIRAALVEGIPAGVPVKIKSPGSSVMIDEM